MGCGGHTERCCFPPKKAYSVSICTHTDRGRRGRGGDVVGRKVFKNVLQVDGKDREVKNSTKTKS